MTMEDLNKFLLRIIFLLCLSSCYTQFASSENNAKEIIDKNVFLPNSSFATQSFSISNLYQEWIYSREENVGDLKFYRPNGYKEFPRSRFRHKMIFHKNGLCEYYSSAPDDRHKYQEYRWRLLREDNLTLVIYNRDGSKFKNFHIESLVKDLLKFWWITEQTT